MSAQDAGSAYSLYWYTPNRGACLAFASMFLTSASVHLYQTIRYRSFKLTFFLPWGTLIISAGYAMRAVGTWDTENLGYFIAQYVLLLAGPPVYAACLYLVLSRCLYYIPWLSPIHPGRVLTTFLGLDLLCELLIGTGAPRAANSTLSHADHLAGLDLIKAGMVLQCVLLASFLGMAAYFHSKCVAAGVIGKVIRPLTLLYVTGCLIIERSILRTIENFQGFQGTVYRSQVIFWVLEASVMLLVSCILNFWHPARLLPSSNKVFVTTDGTTERLGPGWVDKRPFILTLFDPFNLASLCCNKYKADRFWEDDKNLQIVSSDSTQECEKV